MKSPITGKEMQLIKERRSMVFRKETFEVVFHYYRCEDTGEQFTTTALDEVNMNQVYHQYRDKFNIPFTDEIISIREKYGLPAARMSEVLGFGINTYRQYEAGEMPSIANAKLIQMVDDPKKFMDMVELCGTLNDSLKEKYIRKAKALVEERELHRSDTMLKDYLLGPHLADIYSGYRNPNLEKLAEMVIYFAVQLQPFKTKMNKLLFYADFLMFKQSCFSISGVRYKAIDRSPVPFNFQSVFEYLANEGAIDIKTTEFQGGYSGEQFFARSSRPFNQERFTDSELQVIRHVASVFKNTATTEIVEKSHAERAWKENITGKGLISYEYAFELRIPAN
jgi:putative zinc finger/helix-turn-helix YgiT family protein